ncbi:MAG: hypothetical protein WAU45_04745 [Blastocatellia bacterium]
MKKFSLLILAILVPISGFGYPQKEAANKGGTQQIVPPGSKLFIAPMEGNLHPFIAAEIMKKKIPVVVVTDEKEADFILAGASIKGDDKWYHTVFGGKDKNEGSVQLLSVKDKIMVWAGEAGDRSLWWGNFKRGGQRKVADRIVTKMNDQLFKNSH